ncbi:MAG TPA: YdiU family protein [Tepidisphaeraceae bacterium]
MKLAECRWESRFVGLFPGDSERRNFTRPVRNICYSEVQPTPVQDPRLIGWASRFAGELGIARPGEEDRASLEILSGNRVLPDMRPYAARYGGHQFGHWAGQLGDGRAITLGEISFEGAGRWEFQLKGAGPTPYSRRADGRAVLRSSVREFLCSEAMHFLGVPTTRAISLVTTGDAVTRDMFYDGNPAAEPGAIVCRVAPSFLRFGNFEILASSDEHDLLKRLTDFLIADHYPMLDPIDPDVYGKLLDEISRRTAEMIVHWMRVGFVHGVMNTDNMSALGLTIDYGPYGWLEPYEPHWTPNTTDAQQGRYRFGNQPSVALWNLGRLGAALFPLINNEDRVYQALDQYRETFQSAHAQMMAGKLGLASLTSDEDFALVEDLTKLLEASEADYTLFFRRLSEWPASSGTSNSVELMNHVVPSFYRESIDAGIRQQWAEWALRYGRHVAEERVDHAERSLRMKRVNPKYVLRNYLAQNAITAATQGDNTVLERLLRVLETPYDEQPGEDDLAVRRPDWARNAPGCSALSCSS